MIDEALLRRWGFAIYAKEAHRTRYIVLDLATADLPTDLHVDIFDDGHVEVQVAQTVGNFKHYVRIFSNLISVSQAEMIFGAFCLRKRKLCQEHRCKGTMNVAWDGVGERYFECSDCGTTEPLNSPPARNHAHDGGIRVVNGRYESANNSEGI